MTPKHSNPSENGRSLNRPRLLIALGAGLLLAGCASSVVTSNRFDPTVAQAGVIYSLPKQYVLVKVVRELSDQDKLAAEVGKRQTASATARKNEAEKKGAVDSLTLHVAQAPDAETRKEFEDKLKLARVELEVATILAKVAAETEKQAVRDLRDFQPDGMHDTITLEAQSAVPDPEHTFVAQLKHSALRSDSVTLKTSSAGLLEGYVGIADDQTDDVILKAVEALRYAFAIGGGGIGFRATKTLPTNLPPFTYERLIDPTNLTDLQDVNTDLKVKGAAYELKLIGDIKNYGHSVTASEGLYYRRPVLRNLAVYSIAEEGKESEYLQSISLLLPNNGPIGRIDLPASRMVSTEFEFAFKDGMLLTFDTVRPSEALAAASLIPNVLRAIVAIPTELIQLKIDYSTKDKALIDAKTSLAESRLALLNADNALTAARTPATPAPAPANPAP